VHCAGRGQDAGRQILDARAAAQSNAQRSARADVQRSEHQLRPVPGGSFRDGASLLTGQLTLGPLQSKLEIGAVSVQSGTDADAGLALARGTTVLNAGGGYSVTVVDELGSARANLGEHNDDGSIGGNIGSGATLAGTEATINTPYGSVTYGQSVALSLGGSMGVRDADHDGKLEFCAKFSIPAYTVGACVEQFW